MAGRADVLAALRAQGAPDAALYAVEAWDAERARIKANRFNAEREAEEIAAADADCLKALEACAVAAETDVDAACGAALEEFDAARRQRAGERRELRDVIDLPQLRVTNDATEILRMVADADLAGETVGQEARRVAADRLRQLAAAEIQQGKQNGSAFLALCQVSNSRRPAARADVVGRFDEEKKARRRLIAEVAAAAGLGGRFSRAAVHPMMPEPEVAAQGRRSSLTFGSFWDKHPGLQGR
jgi:hypothetical protein